MYIKYFATNRDQENLGRDIERKTRIELQKGGYNWIDAQKYMSHYLATTDPTRMTTDAIVKSSKETIFDGFLKNPKIKRIVICVHGFNVHLHGALTSFSILTDTLEETKTKLGQGLIVDPSQIAKKENLNDLTAVVGFSWPSNGRVCDYKSDRLEAISSAAALANLISAIKSHCPRVEVHIIAHSMGNFLVCNMLKSLVNYESLPCNFADNEELKSKLELEIGRRGEREGANSHFFVDSYIMLAPDVERRHVTQCNKSEDDPQHTKASYIGPFYGGLHHLVGGTYLFYSRYDQALKASKLEKEVFRENKLRGITDIFTGPDLENLWEDSLGLNPAPNLAPSNFYSFNASTLSNRPIDHGDYFDTPAIAQKISEIILNYQTD
ncbi:MAG: alpha/beta hydrolase [Snowella sp.]|nr:alpha/beta hydrolase [Snowella sp.]